MRPGWIVSIIGHAGAALMTILTWATAVQVIPTAGNVVPVEIVATAPDSNVRALSASQEEPTPAPAETAPAPAPAPVPTPPPPHAQPRHDDFDLSAIAGLLDKQRHATQERTNGARADRSQHGTGPATADVVSLQDRVRALTRQAMQRCWRMPSDLPDPERLVVTVQFELDRNGHLRGQPRVTSPQNYTFDASMRTAAESALRAVRACDPYPFPDDPVVGDHFELWSVLEYTFRPTE